MNTKEIFQKVKNHLLNQNKHSLNRYNQSAYYGTEGKKCSIGILINPEFYDERFEGKAICSIEIENAVEKSIGKTLEQKEKEMLRKLQKLHDFTPVNRWLSELDKIEQEYFPCEER